LIGLAGVLNREENEETVATPISLARPAAVSVGGVPWAA
jgi:hypothetical protein